jgi:peptidoglycan/LPS O-acetylase OafA/YrhL
MDQSRLPSLDGLRAVSISLVLYCHLTLSKTVGAGPLGRRSGFLGVLIFFVISGYIITKLLLREKDRTGSISLSQFYGRRFVRIMPALTFFLIGVAFLAKLNLTDASMPELLWSLTFLRNYHVSIFPSLRHLWSLSVEEQFYVLWPVILAKCSRKTCIRLLLTVIVIAPVARLLIFQFYGRTDALYWHSESLADGLAMGCLLAIGGDRLHQSHLYRRFSNSVLVMLIPVVVVVFVGEWNSLLQTFGRTIVFAAIAVGIDVAILHADSLVGRVLNSSFLKWLGMLSYSLYLWQQIFTLPMRGTRPYAWFPMNLALALVAATASYYLIERPMLTFGRRLMGNPRYPRAQAGLLELADLHSGD